MYRLCTTEKTATQQRKFHNALYINMQDRLYSDITITELCTQTGLSRNIFYRLFDCKEDVLYALIDNCFFSCSQSISLHDTRNNLIMFFNFWKNQKIILDILKKNRLESLLSIRGTICCCQLDFGIREAIGINASADDIEVVSFYISGFIGLVFQWYLTDFAKSPEEMADIALKILNIANE